MIVFAYMLRKLQSIRYDILPCLKFLRIMTEYGEIVIVLCCANVDLLFIDCFQIKRITR